MIGIVAVKQPPMIVVDNITKSLRIYARQIGVKRLNAIDAQIRTILQIEDVAIPREVPGTRLFRPVYRLTLAHRSVVRIGILHGIRR